MMRNCDHFKGFFPKLLINWYMFFFSFWRRDREPYTEIEGDNNETPVMAPAPAPAPETSAAPETVSEDDVVT